MRQWLHGTRTIELCNVKPTAQPTEQWVGRDTMTAVALPADMSLPRLHRRVARQFAFIGLLINPSCRGAPMLRLNGGQSEL
jgi:hypothetical protein